jgi:hypothetical protein
MERVPADQQDKHSEFGLIPIRAGDFQIGLLPFGDHTGGCSIMEDVGICGGNVLGGVVDHFDINLFISKTYLVLEEGSTEGPFLHMQVYDRLEAL